MQPTQGTPPAAAPEATDSVEKHELRREIVDFFKLVAWFLVIFLGLKFFVIEGFEVQGESMDPTLANNERILVFKLPHQLSRLGLFPGLGIGAGDIVVFNSPDGSGKRYVKRVIATGPRAGDTVHAATASPADPASQVLVTFDHGDVFINNRRVSEDYLTESARTSPERQEVRLGPGEYYVLGDNRIVSRDSRSFKAVRDEAMVGKAVIRFWPLSKLSLIQ